MIRHTNFFKILLSCFSIGLLVTGMIHTANAAPDNAKTDNAKEMPQSNQQKFYGKVTEVIDAGSYTYAEVDTGKEKVWAAGPPTELKAGDMISFSSQMPMQNFHSKAVGRDFPVIYFVGSYITDKGTLVAVSPHTQMKQQEEIKPIEGIKKVDGGYTIAEIYADKNNLKEKTVRVRGQVVKYTANILNKNWLHIRDSSTLDDLTVTSASAAAVGDVVIAEGKLELDKDYKYGYLYPVIIESATITQE
jgi:hypothetical protein